MAAYTYKKVYRKIPEHIYSVFTEVYDGEEPDDDPGYNGDLWLLTDLYITELENKVSLLEEVVRNGQEEKD